MAGSQTRIVIREDGLTLKERVALERAPKLPPEKQWWNVPAKVAKAKEIAQQERERSLVDAGSQGLSSAHNNAPDAMRHARWSQRMVTEIDPISARLFGIAHEFEGSLPAPDRLKRWNAPQSLQQLARDRDWHDQSDSEALMDMRNNAEGRRAAQERRAVNPANLQIQLNAPSVLNPAYPRARPRGGGPGWR